MNDIDQIMRDALDGEPEASERERDFMRRAVERLIEGEYLIGRRDSLVVLRDAPATPALPAPRLQLRWADPRTCHYELILSVSKGDIRSDHAPGGLLAVPISITRRWGDREPLEGDRIETPFRDGCHITWDAHATGLPAFVTYGERSRRLEPAPRPEVG